MNENHIAMTILISVSVVAALGLVFLYSSEQTAQVVLYDYGVQSIYGGAKRQAYTPLGPALEQQESRRLGSHSQQYTPDVVYATASPGAHIATYGKEWSKIPAWVSETGFCGVYANGQPRTGRIDTADRAEKKDEDCLQLVGFDGRAVAGRVCCLDSGQSSLPGSI